MRTLDTPTKRVRPFLKWAGGKFALLDLILAHLPKDKTRLIEPFVGSGAVFLNTDYPEYWLSDTNADLIRLYRFVQEEGEAFITDAAQWFQPDTNQPDAFLELRQTFNTTTDLRLKAQLFLYLNRHGYNGLCRYNRKGIFNVPFGRYKAPYFPLEELRHFHQKAQRATFQVLDFQEAMAQAQPGDVVYCDPPYVPLSATAHFTSYSANAFGPAEQLALAASAQALTEREIPVLISNHDTATTRQAYEQAKTIVSKDVQRFISCRGSHRKPAAELLAIFE